MRRFVFAFNVLQMCLENDMTEYKFELFRDEDVVISRQHFCNQSIHIGPFQKSSKSVLRFVFNDVMIATTTVSNLLRQERNEIILEVKHENMKKKTKKVAAVIPTSSQVSSLRVRYVTRSQTSRRRQRNEILLDVKRVIKKYGDNDVD